MGEEDRKMLEELITAATEAADDTHYKKHARLFRAIAAFGRQLVDNAGAEEPTNPGASEEQPQ
jgi:hypothetical protein